MDKHPWDVRVHQRLGFFLIRLGGRIALGKPVQATLTVYPPTPEAVRYPEHSVRIEEV